MKVRSPLLAVAIMAAASITAGAASAAAGTQSPAHAITTTTNKHPAAPPPGVVVQGFQYMPGVHLPGPHLPHLKPKATVYSDNWSGYASVANSGVQLQSISADFNIPSVNCSNSPVGSSGYAFSSHWVGLDGYGDGTVEQTGVSAYCNSAKTPGYYAWYEMYPLAPVAFSGVSPGDAITVTVSYSSSAHNYHLKLTDVTTGGYISSTQTCPKGSTCGNASAEVISEDPGGAVAGGYNLSDFGMANYTAARVTSLDGLSGTLAASSEWSSSELVMADSSGTVMALPSGLYGGRSFNITWKSAT